MGIIELGGGFKSRDVQRYFKSTLNMKSPKVVAISVDGGHNKPTGDPSGPDGEVLLDIEVGATGITGGVIVAAVHGDGHDVGGLHVQSGLEVALNVARLESTTQFDDSDALAQIGRASC